MKLPAILTLFFLLFLSSNTYASFLIGSSKVDMTGRLGTQMMGFVDPVQSSKGIHTRLYSRTFVVEEIQGKVVALATVDLQGVYSSLKDDIIKRLNADLPGVFSHHNVFINATHTHAASAGVSYHLMYNLYFGFDQQTFDQYAKGISQSIKEAYLARQPGRIFFNKGQLQNASMNRSLEPFHQNPEAESEDIDQTDKSFYQMSFYNKEMLPIGVLNWFAVHATSMSKKNRFLSGDNKGVAALYLEKHFEKKNPNFVAAFANGPLGDVSPLPNRYFGDNDYTDLESTLINGKKQFIKSLELLSKETKEIKDNLDYSHIWYDIAQKGCQPALGFSTLAGADDGPSEIGGFFEGMLSDKVKHPIGKLVIRLISKKVATPATEEQKKCHAEKPLMADLSPDFRAALIIPFQNIRLGHVLIAAVPSEITTIASYRLTKAIRTEDSHNELEHIIISSPSNMYSGYLATAEEYSLQHYEGASTMYGPETLNLYIDGFKLLTNNILNAENNQVLADDVFVDYIARAHENRNNTPKILKVMNILKPHFIRSYTARDRMRFGSPVGRVKKKYIHGKTIKATFLYPHQPSKNHNGANHFIIQRYEDERWETAYTEKSPETAFRLHRLGDRATIKVHWQLTKDVKPGKYRIVVGGKTDKHSFSGKSRSFKVTAK